MSKSAHSSPAGRKETLLALVLAFALCLGIQGAANAWQAEAAEHPDEAAHLVSAVMVYEYVRELAPEPPLEFAEKYYAHYPKVGIGHWPPGFHALLAAWMFLAGVGRIRGIIFMAVLAALAATLLYRFVRRELGVGASATVTALFLLLPATQYSVNLVMTEMPVALWCIAGAAAYAAYLDKPGWRFASVFGLVAGVGLLTKGVAIGLAAIPPGVVLLQRRFSLLKRWDFWLPAAIVLATAGPWYMAPKSFVPNAMGSTANRIAGLRSVVPPVEKMLFWAKILGPALAAAALIALALVVLLPAIRGKLSTTAAVAGSFVLGVAAFNVVLPESAEPRHVHHGASLAIALVGLAIQWVGNRFQTARLAQAGLWAALLAVFFLQTFTLKTKPRLGLRDASIYILADDTLRGTAVMISSERFGEGALIAEIAMDRPQPDIFTLRATKTLAATSWSGRRYDLKIKTVDEMARYLESLPVAIVVIDDAPPAAEHLEHHALLAKTMESFPDRWREVQEYNVEGAPWADRPWQVKVYRSTSETLKVSRPIQIDMERRLNKVLEVPPDQ